MPQTAPQATMRAVALDADGRLPVPRPFVAGFEAAGRIVAVGPGVERGRVGEPVAVLVGGGAHAEVVLAPAVLAVRAEGVDARTAAGFGWSTPTAYDLVHTVARIGPGDRVLIHGAAGAVGTMAAQFAAAAGAGRITGVAGNDERSHYARQFGFHRVVTRDAFPDALAGESFDAVLDPVGGATRVASLALLAPHGRLVAYGEIAGADPVRVSVGDLLASGRSLLTHNGDLLGRTHPARLAESARRALALVADGTVRVDVTAEHALADVGEAVAGLAAGRTLGKGIVRVR
ncbi:putative oxidoreductase [Kitasatospora setae KM-6054]|uniref:Putative oxidoreductase n=1 Tax=Kitasatospora setae (strain ATCC 33774 / DSM 43861 / JCM 3304 / KCC A-0304 / NBRC 14216 / KM-6054) TaxID=452652 RepID=E4N0M4_KITSK|nr:putative oxidoreductase [Kitasatospora setae KM-6054]